MANVQAKFDRLYKSEPGIDGACSGAYNPRKEHVKRDLQEQLVTDLRQTFHLQSFAFDEPLLLRHARAIRNGVRNVAQVPSKQDEKTRQECLGSEGCFADFLPETLAKTTDEP
jgi:hypothetical protein